MSFLSYFFRPKESPTEKYWHNSFFIILAFKILFTIAELIVGTCLVLFDNQDFLRALHVIAIDYLQLDPEDKLFHTVYQALYYFPSDLRYTLIIYAFSHVIVKSIVFYGILAKKMWAYPFAILVFSGLIIQQMVHLFYKFSWAIAIITSISILFVILTWHEYQHIKKSQ